MDFNKDKESRMGKKKKRTSVTGVSTHMVVLQAPLHDHSQHHHPRPAHARTAQG